MIVAYVRVSTVEQNEARQVEALQKHGIEKWYTEKVSGKDTKREQLQLMLDFVREGDVIYTMDFSRLSRSVSDLLNIIETLDNKGVRLVSLKENLESKVHEAQKKIADGAEAEKEVKVIRKKSTSSKITKTKK